MAGFCRLTNSWRRKMLRRAQPGTCWRWCWLSWLVPKEAKLFDPMPRWFPPIQLEHERAAQVESHWWWQNDQYAKCEKLHWTHWSSLTFESALVHTFADNPRWMMNFRMFLEILESYCCAYQTSEFIFRYQQLPFMTWILLPIFLFFLLQLTFLRLLRL